MILLRLGLVVRQELPVNDQPVYRGSVTAAESAKAVVPILKRLMRIPWDLYMPAWQVYNAFATLLAREPVR